MDNIPYNSENCERRLEDRARSLKFSGLPVAAIADLLDVSKGTVAAWLGTEESAHGNRHGGRGGCGAIEVDGYGHVLNQRIPR